MEIASDFHQLLIYSFISLIIWVPTKDKDLILVSMVTTVQSYVTVPNEQMDSKYSCVPTALFYKLYDQK